MTKAERNAEIIRRHAAGERQAAIAASFGISKQRVDQIVHSRKRKPRPHRPAPSAEQRHEEAVHALISIERSTDDRWVKQRCAGVLDREDALLLAKYGRRRNTQERPERAPVLAVDPSRSTPEKTLTSALPSTETGPNE